MKVIVTGGCGFIGSHIVDKLVELKHQVLVIDDLSASENEQFYFNGDNLKLLKFILNKILFFLHQEDHFLQYIMLNYQQTCTPYK